MIGRQSVRIIFIVDGSEYAGDAAPNEIIHEVFPRTLTASITAGRRVSFRSESGAELFADNFVRDVAAGSAEVRIVTRSETIPITSGDWRNIGIDHLAITVADRS